MDWSEWIRLEEALALPVIPAGSGLYRLRAVGEEQLAYIGQTGRSLRERVRALRGIFRDEMPYRDPHTVGPALWAWLREAQRELEVSVSPVGGSTAARKAAEAVAIAEHRQQHGASPHWNFGRMPRGFRMSSANNARLVSAESRFRGGPCGEPLAAHEAGIAPAGSLDPDVMARGWCGHTWSQWAPLNAQALGLLPRGSGLYRIRGQGRLLYVGEGQVRARLILHAQKLGADTPQGRALAAAAPLEFSAILNDGWASHHRLELETDLIAAHTLAAGRPPDAQFIG